MSSPGARERTFLLRSGTSGVEVMRMKFVVKKTSDGQFRFNPVASNGQVVATKRPTPPPAADGPPAGRRHRVSRRSSRWRWG